jgi:hypothetical protein
MGEPDSQQRLQEAKGLIPTITVQEVTSYISSGYEDMKKRPAHALRAFSGH